MMSHKHFCCRNKFKFIQTEFLEEQFKKYFLKYPDVSNRKPVYWCLRYDDLFGRLDAYMERLNCLKVCKKLL